MTGQESKSLFYKNNNKAIFVLSMFAAAAGNALAATPTLPDPSGRIDKNIEIQKRRLTESPPERKSPVLKKEDDDSGQDKTELSNDPMLVLQGIRFTESEHLSRDELQTAVQPWLGKPVSYQDLQNILAAIKQLYRTKGIYTATAVFPEQRIEQGIVSIRLIEGRFGQLVLSGNVEEDDKDYYQNWIHSDWQKDSIDVDALERDILFYNRVHGQRLQAELAAGQAFGLTDVVIRVPESEQGLDLHIDNHGADSTGREQFTLLYQKTSVFDPGDKLLAYGHATEGIKSISGSYNRVVGYRGWRAGGSFQYTNSDWDVAGFDQNLAVTGDSIRFSVDSSYLAWSGVQSALNLLFSINHSRSTNEIADEVFSEFRTTQIQTGAELTWLGENWEAVGKLMFSRGKSLSLVDNNERYASLWHPSGVINYHLSKSWGIKSLFEAQWTRDKQLPATFGFAQGGAYSIRGYPESLSGDTGWRLQTELHHYGAISGKPVDTYVFYDYGEVTNPQHTQQQASAGMGALVSFDWGSLTLTAARTLKEVAPFNKGFRVYARISFTGP